jgi:hypothetical protein
MDDLTEALQVCATTGVTYRQLDSWSRSGLVHAVGIPSARTRQTTGSGVRRGYPPEEVAVVAVMARLVRVGLSPAAAARAARNNGDLGDGIRIVLEDAANDITATLRALHTPCCEPGVTGCTSPWEHHDGRPVCVVCTTWDSRTYAFPCPTIRALDGEFDDVAPVSGDAP